MNAEGINTRILRAADYSLFLQDDWKLSQNLKGYRGCIFFGYSVLWLLEVPQTPQ
jgi:hypothetical protein